MLKLTQFIIFLFAPITLFANEPKDWQLGFQKAGSGHMEAVSYTHLRAHET